MGMFTAALLAQQAGAARGRVDAYKDRVAEEADMKRQQEQQREFDERMAQQASQFDTSTGLMRARDANTFADSASKRGLNEAAGGRDATKFGWDVQDRAPGGYVEQTRSQALARGNLANTGLGIQNQGRALDNQGKLLANDAQRITNRYSPLTNQLDQQMKQLDIKYAQSNTPEMQQQRAIQLDSIRQNSSLQLYKAERVFDQALLGANGGVDPAKAGRAYQDSVKALGEDSKNVSTALDAMAKSELTETSQLGPDGTPAPKRSEVVRSALQHAQQVIAQSPDPVQTANDLIVSSNPAAEAIRSAGFSAYLMQQAWTEKMRRGLPGVKAPAAASSPQPTQSTPIRGLQLNLNGAPSPFQAVGGSSAPSPFRPF